VTSRILLWAAIAYGYKPWRALWPAAGVVLVGWVIFGLGAGAMIPAKDNIRQTTPTAEKYYAPFDPLTYSIDTFLPIIDLGQKKAWIPDVGSTAKFAPPCAHGANRLCTLLPVTVRNAVNRVSARVDAGQVLNTWRLWEIGIGRLLTTLAAAGITGLTRTP
jgi:hypothetical protein